MAISFGRYNAPGVMTQSVSGPIIGTTSTVPNAVGIFGDSVRYRTNLEVFTIPSDVNGVAIDTPAFSKLGIIGASVVVSNPATGQTYVVSSDYVLVGVPGLDGGSTRDDTFSLERVINGDIDEGTRVEVSYHYTDVNYFEATRFYYNGDVEAFYGAPFDSSGNIVSEITLAARLAFLNGASSVICVAVDATATTPTVQEYVTALDKLSDEQDVAIVVPASGDVLLHPYVTAHVVNASNSSMERRAIVARDGSLTAVSSAARIISAGTISNNRIAHVSPATFNYYNSNLGQSAVVGGQFMAAAIAALSLTNGPSIPLTRKQPLGFIGIPEQLSQIQKNLEAEAGLMVVETTRLGAIRVRHGITTDPSTTITREWSITGQEDSMIYRVRDSLDNNGIIGGIIDDLTLVNVKSTVGSALQALVLDGTIQDFTGLQARQLVSTPDVVEIQYQWRAAVPLNYVLVQYSVSISTGTTTVQTS